MLLLNIELEEKVIISRIDFISFTFLMINGFTSK